MTGYLKNDKVHVSASVPAIRLEGTETSAANLELRENAGNLELYDVTNAVVRAQWSGATGRRLTPLIVNAEIAAAAALDATKIANGTVTSVEFQYIGDLTSLAQAQIDTKAPLAAPTFTGLIKKSTTAAITAFATGGQASAVELVSDINEVSVCATAADSVKLPGGIAGMEIMVVNRGAAAMDLFPAVGDFVNEAAADTAVSIAINATAIAYCYVADNWEVVEVSRA